MKIDQQQVRYVAGLANLKLSDAEVERFSHDLDEILTHIDALNELDTTDVEPMTQLMYGEAPDTTLRPDEVRPPLGNTLALANAALTGAGCFKVPKVIER